MADIIIVLILIVIAVFALKPLYSSHRTIFYGICRLTFRTFMFFIHFENSFKNFYLSIGQWIRSK